jgi:hypothetical protein
MRKIIVYALISVLCLSTISLLVPKVNGYTEMPPIQWSKDVGGWTMGQTIQTSNGDYLTVGNYGTGIYIVRLDASGNYRWQPKIYSVAPAAVAVVETDDGGFAIACGGSAQIIKVDGFGNELWHRDYPAGSFTHIAKTSDGGLIATGPKSGSGDWDFYTVKMDNEGRIIWEKTADTGNLDWPSHVLETWNHDFLVVGYGNGQAIMMVKYDFAGNPQWDTPKIWKPYYAEQTNTNWVIQIEENGYIIPGSIRLQSGEEHDGLLLKVDSNGNEQWHEVYDGAPDSGFTSVAQTKSKGYLLVGLTGASSNDKSWLLETDSSGNKIWGYEFPESLTTSVFQTADGGYILGQQIQVGGTQTAGLRVVKLVAENSYPVLGEISVPLNPVPINTIVTANAPFTDADVSDTHTAIWSWGDGSTSTGSVTENSGTGQIYGTHVYATPGIYTISVTVADSFSACDTKSFQFIVVYDPSGGFVTGGGWINSPQGAYADNPELSGKATFGFVTKYQKGANVPVGNTEFSFNVAGLKFHSESYQWLVVAGSKAQFKGEGVVNGDSGYGFMLTAKDGQINSGQDCFRIKIWDKTTGAIVYDNQMGNSDDASATTAIQGGNIVIHK